MCVCVCVYARYARGSTYSVGVCVTEYMHYVWLEVCKSACMLVSPCIYVQLLYVRIHFHMRTYVDTYMHLPTYVYMYSCRYVCVLFQITQQYFLEAVRCVIQKDVILIKV